MSQHQACHLRLIQSIYIYKWNFAVTNIFSRFFGFDLHPELPNRKPNGFFSCTDCIYHKNGYSKPCKSFTFKLTNGKSFTWKYYKFFDCDSRDVLYILICNNCDYFYIGKTIDFKQIIRKYKSNGNSTCRECWALKRLCKNWTFFSDLSVLSWKRSLP